MSHSVSLALRSLLFTVLVAPAGCSGSADDAESAPTSAQQDDIVHGKADGAHDPAVLALDVGGEGLCTATLVAPRVVLTARHCVSHTTEQVACPAHGRQIQGDRDPSTLVVRAGATFASSREVGRGVKLFVPASDELCAHDVALIELDHDVAGIHPLAVRLGHAPAVGEQIRAVGYGKRADQGGAGNKLFRAHIPVLAVSHAELEVGESTCNGDSGGPAIDEATGEVIGVVSRGGPECVGASARNLYTRADAFAALVRRATGG